VKVGWLESTRELVVVATVTPLYATLIAIATSTVLDVENQEDDIVVVHEPTPVDVLGVPQVEVAESDPVVKTN